MSRDAHPGGLGATARLLIRALGLTLLAVLPVAAAVAAESPPVDANTVTESPAQLLYRQGRLPSGEELRGTRGDGQVLEGAAAACVNCHHRSGLGGTEGGIRVPPVIGPYLFRDRETNVTDLAIPHIAGYVPNAKPYDPAALALAIRTGMAPGGRTLSPLMPRYALDDHDIEILTDYLRDLSGGSMPGVSDGVVDLATIVTPDADPIARDAMLKVLQVYLQVRNASVAPRVQSKRSGNLVEYRAIRIWRLHVWQLVGPPASWEQQLLQLQATEPVFAVVAGLGGRDWGPVHRFCQRDRVPCLFPNLDLPPVAEQDFYPVYFSRGVLLEADLIASRLADGPPNPAARLVQILRDGDVGAAAQQQLRAAAKSGWTTLSRVLPPAGPELAAATRRRQVLDALKTLGPTDTIVLWLRAADVEALPDRAPAGALYMSGTMANLEAAPLPRAWRERVRLAYPYDTPLGRRARMNFPLAWLQNHSIGLSAELVQANTYLTCQILEESFDALLDAYVPDYLVERVEAMVGQLRNTGYFPRLGLSSGVRFASKGGYLARFPSQTATLVDAEGPWLVPSGGP